MSIPKPEPRPHRWTLMHMNVHHADSACTMMGLPFSEMACTQRRVTAFSFRVTTRMEKEIMVRVQL